jgi:antitoxin component of RelBE/YafQ-DinJ toxin-antitoxin module
MEKQEKMTRVDAMISAPLKERAKVVAAKKWMTLSEVMRVALEEYVTRNGG